jgi:integrase/recombinase XerD
MNKTVSILKRVKVNGMPKYCPTIDTSNGKIRADVVVVNGQAERHPEGTFYLSFYEGKKQIRVAVGTQVSEAVLARECKEAELKARNAGVEVVETDEKGKRSLAFAIDEYLAEAKLTKKKKTFQAYTTALAYFKESCHKVYVTDVDRRDLLKFAAYLRDEKDQSPRSVANKFDIVTFMLKANGISGLVKGKERPQYTEEVPEIYEDEELKKFFEACDEDERLWFTFFLLTGMREQEVMHAYWSDVSFAYKIIRVTHKPDRGWTPKAYKEREIPLYPELAELLKARKEKVKGTKCPLIFPTSGCNVKMNFLDDLKAVAERVELNKEKFWLHKFRATFATRCLWAGIDLRTVQSYLGHSDMESTMRYLKPARNTVAQEKFNSVFAGAL